MSKHVKDKINKFNIFLSLTAIFIIVVCGIFFIKAEFAQKNVIMIPLCEEYEKDDVKININTAKKEELCLLFGIGEEKANDIIKYRNENSFSKPEDIKNVKGIGNGIYEKIKDKICVN